MFEAKLSCTANNGKLPANLRCAITPWQRPYTFPYKWGGFALLWWLVSLLLVLISKKASIKSLNNASYGRNWELIIGYAFMLIGFCLERLHSISMQNEHYFTLSAIRFSTNSWKKDPSIKPLVRGYGKNCCLLQPCITQIILWIWSEKLVHYGPLLMQFSPCQANEQER